MYIYIILYASNMTSSNGTTTKVHDSTIWWGRKIGFAMFLLELIINPVSDFFHIVQKMTKPRAI